MTRHGEQIKNRKKRRVVEEWNKNEKRGGVWGRGWGGSPCTSELPRVCVTQESEERERKEKKDTGRVVAA